MKFSYNPIHTYKVNTGHADELNLILLKKRKRNETKRSLCTNIGYILFSRLGNMIKFCNKELTVYRWSVRAPRINFQATIISRDPTF